MWDANPGYGWFGVDPSTGTGQISSVRSGAVSLSRFNGTLVPIDDGRVCFWGGSIDLERRYTGRANRATTATMIQSPRLRAPVA